MYVLIVILAVVLLSAIFVLMCIFDNPSNSKGESINSKGESIDWSVLQTGQEYYIGRKVIGLSPRKGYDKFQLININESGLTYLDIGKFEGYCFCEEDNEDRTVTIFREDKTVVGFVPCYAFLRRYIAGEGGFVHCYGYLIFDQHHYDGEVCIEVDKKLVRFRNKPFNTTDKFYTPKIELKEFLKSMQSESDI